MHQERCAAVCRMHWHTASHEVSGFFPPVCFRSMHPPQPACGIQHVLSDRPAAAGLCLLLPWRQVARLALKLPMGDVGEQGRIIASLMGGGSGQPEEEEEQEEDELM